MNRHKRICSPLPNHSATPPSDFPYIKKPAETKALTLKPYKNPADSCFLLFINVNARFVWKPYLSLLDLLIFSDQFSGFKTGILFQTQKRAFAVWTEL